MNQEEKDGMRREKEKEEEERKRKEDKEEVKKLIKSQMTSIKLDIMELKAKQNIIENKVLETETEMLKKYDNMANKLGNLEKKIRLLEERETQKEAEKEDCGKISLEIHPVGSSWPAPQPVAKTCPALQPVGGKQASFQPAGHIVDSALQPDKVETNNEIYRVVRQARKTIGFIPINNSDIQEIMGELKIENLEVGMEEAAKEFLRAEMALPEEVIRKLQFAKMSKRPNDDKMYVEFEEEFMSAIVYKYVKKMRSHCKVLTYIPEAFRVRAGELEKTAYDIRHSTPPYTTKIRWGWGDLILERKLKGSREQFRSVHMSSLPPVDLTATPRERLANPTSSPAPGRKKRSTSDKSPNLPNQYFQ